MTTTTRQNRVRAARGATAIRQYVGSPGEVVLDERVIDLIADVCHATRAAGLDPEPLLRIAVDHYAVEIAEEESRCAR
jgi:hypothetical protein